jgi:hypothetical protein
MISSFSLGNIVRLRTTPALRFTVVGVLTEITDLAGGCAITYRIRRQCVGRHDEHVVTVHEIEPIHEVANNPRATEEAREQKENADYVRERLSKPAMSLENELRKTLEDMGWTAEKLAQIDRVPMENGRTATVRASINHGPTLAVANGQTPPPVHQLSEAASFFEPPTEPLLARDGKHVLAWNDTEFASTGGGGLYAVHLEPGRGWAAGVFVDVADVIPLLESTWATCEDAKAWCQRHANGEPLGTPPVCPLCGERMGLERGDTHKACRDREAMRADLTPDAGKMVKAEGVDGTVVMISECEIPF